MFPIATKHKRATPQRGSVDADLLMISFMTVVGAALAVLVVSSLIGASVWDKYFGEPAPTLAQQLESERKFLELKDDRALLLAQLPKDASDLKCVSAAAAQALDCEMVEYGSLKRTTRFRVLLAPGLPRMGLVFHAGRPEKFTLEYHADVPCQQRLEVLRSIKLS